jgi:hypothetical protein
MSGQINEVAGALASAQAELEAAKKDNSGYGYNYSDLATVIASAKPVLTKNGLAITQLVGESIEGNVSVTTILAHTSGQFFKSTASLPIIDMKGCNAAQNAGASLSYLRRYAYQAIIGQPSEDNDASSSGFSTGKPVKKTAAPSKPAAPKTEKPKAASSFKNRKPKKI